MSDERIEIAIPSDRDGFVSFQCPFCGQRFKLLPGEVQADDVFELFCPYCGLTAERQEFVPDAVKKQAISLAKNRLIELINKLGDNMENTFKNKKYVTFKRREELQIEDVQPLIEDDDLDVISLACCHRRVKVSGVDLASDVYCPYCGVK